MALPECAEPHRDLVVAWYKARRIKHPKAPNALDPASVTALEHAAASGVLPEFLKEAADQSLRTLGHQYRVRVERLKAGGSQEGFEAFKAAYLATPKRSTSQTIPQAMAEFSKAVRNGYSAQLLLDALKANKRAMAEAERNSGFAACLPDMARWLRDGRYLAYAHADTGDRSEAPPRAAEMPLDADGFPDPFAFAEEIQRRRLAGGKG
jgi:hypothetical protein